MKRVNPSQPLLVTIICLLLVFLRHPQQFYHPQFWIESSDFYFYSSWSNLFDQTNGYICLTQKLLMNIFVVTTIIPAEYHPIIAFLISIVLFLLIIFYFLSTPSRLPKITLFALAIILSPHYGSEVFSKFLYLIWILPLSIFFLLFRDSKNLSHKIVYVDIFLLILAGFSGPLVVILLPALLYVTLIYKNKYYIRLSSIAIFCSLCQIYYLTHDSTRAVSSEVNSQSIFQILEILVRNFLPQYFFPGQIPEYFIALVCLCILIFLALSLEKRTRLEASILGVVFVSSALPPILKLYPYALSLLNPVISNSARYLFYPFVSITFYLVLISIKGRLWGRVTSIALILVAFFYNLSGFQTTSFNYRWAEHIKYAKQNNCRARIPIPFNGKEGFSWIYKRNISNPIICSDYNISSWVDRNKNEVKLINNEEIILRNKNKRAIFTPSNKIEPGNNNFINFSVSIATELKNKVKVGFIFLDSQNKEIKIVADMISDNRAPIVNVYSAIIPPETEIIKPYIHLISELSVVRLSKPSVLLFK